MTPCHAMFINLFTDLEEPDVIRDLQHRQMSFRDARTCPGSTGQKVPVIACILSGCPSRGAGTTSCLGPEWCAPIVKTARSHGCRRKHASRSHQITSPIDLARHSDNCCCNLRRHVVARWRRLSLEVHLHRLCHGPWTSAEAKIFSILVMTRDELCAHSDALLPTVM
jgi:hypothetical protein